MRLILTAAALVAVLLMQGCAAPGEQGDGASAEAYVPQAGLSSQQRFKEVLYLLEEGHPIPARAELVLYLEDQPNSEVGRDLLQQIDRSALDYFPEDYREVTLQPGQSLSTLSQQYLGSLYQFHALAKYNGIAEPRKLRAGQVIRIPLTAAAQDAFAGDSADAQPPAPATAATEPPPVAPQPAAAEPAPAMPAPPDVEQLHREALNAYRAQDLDKAIALWDEVLALQPEHENARLYRSQALELKTKLRNLN